MRMQTPLKPFTKFFFIVFTATFFFTTLFAITHTQGKTVLSIGFCLFVLGLFFCYKQSFLKVKICPYNNFKLLFLSFIRAIRLFFLPFLAFCFAFLIGFCANGYMIFDFSRAFTHDFGFHVPNLDLVGYSNYVNMLLHTAQENYNGFSANYFSTAFHGVSPYHFYEFWLAALLCKVFGFQPIISYWLVVYPLFYAFVVCGFLAIAEQYNTVKLQTFFSCVALLFVGGIYFPFYKYIPFLDSTFYLHNNTLLTYGLIEPFLLASYLCYQHQLYRHAWLFLLVIPIISITTWVGLLGLLCYLWLTKNITFSKSHKNMLPIRFFMTSFVGLTAMLVLFFWLFGTKNQATFSTQELLPIFAFSNFNNYETISFIAKQFLVVFGLYLFKSLLVYAPFLFVIYQNMTQKNLHTIFITQKGYLYSIVVILPLGAMFLMILHHDSSQLFRNFLFPLTNMSIAIYFLHSYFQKPLHKNTKYFLYALLAYQIGFTFYFKQQQIQESNIYSHNYLKEIAAISQHSLKSKFGGFIYGKNFYPDNLFSKVIRHNIPAGYLAVMPQFFTVINLEIFDIPQSHQPINQVFEKRSLQNSEFYQFVEQQKQNDIFINTTQSQIDFIKQNKLAFLVIGKDVILPTNFQSLIKKEIKDTQTGERFLVLK
jgi:hypothetical protein